MACVEKRLEVLPDEVTSTRLLIVRHELGHALGLDHSSAETNAMWAFWNTAATKSFGSEDRSDYGFLWNLLRWATLLWWPK